jgi:hypothetical protein
MSWVKLENLIVEIGRKSQENDRKSKNGVADRDMINLKTAVDFNAEARCARDEVVGLSERSEPEGPQGTARRKVTQRKSEVI